ncbi:MAG: c-type cytochrome [Methyloversatilis sp.]|uniref:c-type cytochrome n=1 Tax=Methyloversatilis sp. TaxID=2569862 RepID=UPI00273385EC|nr:c-type cytochrome [Methyloversatilis sp.]MDP3872220.1 c-type cytochrome [Methyloversatilis sp.]
MTPRLLTALFTASLILLSGTVGAERPAAPLTDTSSLPALGDAWRDANPYRDDDTIAAVGRTLYNETCSKCHGPDMNAKGHPAPPLRRLQRYCKKVQDAALKARCLADVDHYFVTTVLKGKYILGVEHMPAWEGILKQEAVWAIKTYVDSRSR